MTGDDGWRVTIERPDGSALVWQVGDLVVYTRVLAAVQAVTGQEPDLVAP
jgi:hypothetical protein